MESDHTDKYKYCNHHHELTADHEIIDLGTGPFVANKSAIPLLKALNDLGLITRTHHVDQAGGFISIILDAHIDIEIKTVYENDATRTQYNGKTELLIGWNNHKKG